MMTGTIRHHSRRTFKRPMRGNPIVFKPSRSSGASDALGPRYRQRRRPALHSVCPDVDTRRRPLEGRFQFIAAHEVVRRFSNIHRDLLAASDGRPLTDAR
jgi:hypothetical protein